MGAARKCAAGRQAPDEFVFARWKGDGAWWRLRDCRRTQPALGIAQDCSERRAGIRAQPDNTERAGRYG